MKPFLKTLIGTAAPALAAGGILQIGAPLALSEPAQAVVLPTTPLDAPATQPSTQPSTAPAPRPDPIDPITGLRG